jgi:hypothetical protein
VRTKSSEDNSKDAPTAKDKDGFLLINFLGEIEIKDNEALEPPMRKLQKSSEDKSKKNTKTAKANTTKRQSEHG